MDAVVGLLAEPVAIGCSQPQRTAVVVHIAVVLVVLLSGRVRNRLPSWLLHLSEQSHYQLRMPFQLP